ncbi:MAG TPA: AI-2E family transporter [Candidatus Omnitrophota bacterium]|nr:AI-2E family transporter [Candidatus Omnitrophota bacterium]
MEFFDFLSPARTARNASTFKFSFRAKVITLWVVAAIVVLFLLRFSRILPVFVWAAVTAYLFNPIITFFSEKTKTSKVLWILILYILLIGLTFWAVRSLVPLISNEVSDLVSGSLDDPTTFLGRIASQGNISVLGLDISLKDQVALFSNWVKVQFPLQVFPIFFSAVEKLIYLLVYFVITFYLILDAEKYIILLKRIIPFPYRQEIVDLLQNINLTLGAYIRAQVVLIFVMSVISFLALSILRVKYALILSLATGVLEVIPIAGPISATVIAALVALFQVGTPFGISNAALALIVIAVYFGLRQLEDYFVIPNVVSKFVKVHPVVAIFSLMVGGTVGGILGLFLAIPTAAIVMVLSGYIYRKLIED